MATFYVGRRPVLKGKNSNDAVHTWKNKKGTYSNWDIFNTSHVLDGGPDNNYTIGSGDRPHGLQMSRWYRGLDTKFPMDGAGGGTRLSYHRTKMHEYKGLTATQAMNNPGHEARPHTYSWSRNSTTNFFRGVASANPLLNGGHSIRAIGAAGTANSFGRFDPHVNKGVSGQALAGASGGVPAADAVGVYGFEHINEWNGVPSAKAL